MSSGGLFRGHILVRTTTFVSSAFQLARPLRSQFHFKSITMDQSIANSGEPTSVEINHSSEVSNNVSAETSKSTESSETQEAAPANKEKKIRYPTSKQRKEYFEKNKRIRRDGTWPTTREEQEKREPRDPSIPRLPKKKVALLMGFSGSGYSGMMINPNAGKTIEQDLFSALCSMGAVSKDNSDDIKKISFMRAARTDKGVSAAGQVCSLKIS